MLKLPQKHTGDAKADGIIARYLNGNMLGLVKNQIAGYERDQKKEAREDDLDFCEAVSAFFPERYPVEKMGKAFLGLRALLESEYEFVPELAMEYAMYALIQERIEAADGIGVKTLEPISEQREYVAEALRREYPDASGDGEDAFPTWREKLESLEDLHDYETVYFWDLDFLQLELFRRSSF